MRQHERQFTSCRSSSCLVFRVTIDNLKFPELLRIREITIDNRMVSKRVMTLSDFLIFEDYPQGLSCERPTVASVFLYFFCGIYRSHFNSFAKRKKDGTQGNFRMYLPGSLRMCDNMKTITWFRTSSYLIMPYLQ